MDRRLKIGVVALVAVVAVIACVWITVVVGWSNLGHDSVEKLPGLHGLAYADVLDELGADCQVQNLVVADCGVEFRVEIFNTYDPRKPENTSVPIREVVWDRSGYSVAVWFHQVDSEWVALDTLRWVDGVQF